MSRAEKIKTPDEKLEDNYQMLRHFLIWRSRIKEHNFFVKFDKQIPRLTGISLDTKDEKSILASCSSGVGLVSPMYKGKWHAYEVVFKPQSIENFKLDANFVESLDQESILLSILKHPRIAENYGIYIQDQSIFTVSKYYPRDLTQFLKDVNYNQKDVARVFFQIAQGLDYLHHRGVIHSDLASRNVLVDEADDIKLIDFASSAVDSLLKGCDFIDFDRRYPLIAAPEVRELTRRYTTSDIYSFGLMLWAIISRSEIQEIEELEKLELEAAKLSFSSVKERLEKSKESKESKESFDSGDILKNLALVCLNPDFRQRPSTSDILPILYETVVAVHDKDELFDILVRQQSQTLLQAFRRKKFPDYQLLYVTACSEVKAEDEKKASSTLEIFEKFLLDDNQRVLVLSGDCGSGKSTAVYYFMESLLAKPTKKLAGLSKETSFLPILLNSELKTWTHSALNVGLKQIIIDAYQLPLQQQELLSSKSLICFLDDYDQLKTVDEAQAPQNLSVLGLEGLPKTKIIISCSTNSLSLDEMKRRFNFPKSEESIFQYQHYQLQPCPLKTSEVYLKQHLNSLSLVEDKKRYTMIVESLKKRKLLSSFTVLQLLIESWSGLKGLSPDRFSCFEIYQFCLNDKLKKIEKIHDELVMDEGANEIVSNLYNGCDDLIKGCCKTIEKLALYCYGSSKTTLSLAKEPSILSDMEMSWLKLPQQIDDYAKTVFDRLRSTDDMVKQIRQFYGHKHYDFFYRLYQRSADVTFEKNAILTRNEDYGLIQRERMQDYQRNFPLKYSEKLNSCHFRHHSFYTFFVARGLINAFYRNDIIVLIKFLIARPMSKKSDILAFFLEGWQTLPPEKRDAFFQILSTGFQLFSADFLNGSHFVVPSLLTKNVRILLKHLPSKDEVKSAAVVQKPSSTIPASP